MQAKKLGIFTIGGGVPRNWAQQVGPFFDILQNRLEDYFAFRAVSLRHPYLSGAGALGRLKRLHLPGGHILGKICSGK